MATRKATPIPMKSCWRDSSAKVVTPWMRVTATSQASETGMRTFHPSFMKEIALDLSVRNLFNAEYESGGYIYDTFINDGKRVNQLNYFAQATRNFMARLTLKF